MRNLSAVLSAIIVILIPAGHPQAHSAALSSKAWAAYVQAQRQFQRELADFLSNRRPDLKDAIQNNRDLQLALIDRRFLEFNALLSAHPERIVTNQGISKFANFNWTNQDQEALRRVSQEYQAAIKRCDEMRKRSEASADGDALRALQRNLATEPECRQIYERYDRRQRTVQKLLE